MVVTFNKEAFRAGLHLLIGFFVICATSCKNNSNVEDIDREEKTTIGGRVVVSGGTFEDDVDVGIRSVKDLVSVPTGKKAASSEIRIAITDPESGEIIDPEEANEDILLSIETQKVSDANLIEVFVVAKPGTADENTYTIPNSSLTIEALGGGFYKVTIATRETDAVFVVVIASEEEESDTSPTSSAEAPTKITLSSSTLPEKSPLNFSVGTFTTTDADSDTHTYSLVSGSGSNDNSAFSILGNEIRTAAIFDFETKSSYTIRVRTTDNDNKYLEKVFTISVTDVAETWQTPALLEENDDGGASAPQIASDGNGNVIAVWHQSDGTTDSIWSSSYSASSGWSTPVLLETDDTDHAQYPQVVMSENGNAIAIWMQNDGTRFNVWANHYSSADGWGTAELMESDNSGHAWYPAIDMTADGNAVAVWQQSDGTRDNIYARVYTNGTGWGPATLLETDNGSPSEQQVRVDHNGNAIAIWKQSDGTRNNIWSNYFDTAGSGWGTAVLVETDDSGTAHEPYVAFDGTGTALAVWCHSDGSRYNITSNWYEPGTGWGSTELLETDNAGSARRPRIAFDSANNALAVWHQSDGSVLNIWSNYYTAGVAWGTAEKIEIEDTGNAVSPRVNFDANGNALAIWSQFDSTRYNIWINHYTADTGWGTAELIESNNDGDALNPVLVLEPNSNSVAVWSQSDGTRYSIWTNEYH